MPTSTTTRQMGLVSQILFILCSVLIIDTLTAAAALGTGVIGWWIVTLLFFVIPYALIAAELGTSYPSDGGIYSWVKRAFGLKMAQKARALARPAAAARVADELQALARKAGRA